MISSHQLPRACERKKQFCTVTICSCIHDMPSPAAAAERRQEGFSRAGFLKTVYWKSVMQFVFEETIRAYVHVL